MKRQLYLQVCAVRARLRLFFIAAPIFVLLASATPALPAECWFCEPHQSASSTNIDLSALSVLSIEELMQVKLVLSRTDERLSRVPSAAYIITSDEIRRSGATSIPEALRGVPGLEVARVDPHTWAVTARGFNDVFANKLLVMIDGRTAYTPLFSGVFWDVQDTMLEDIDHIEIVRGPGSTLWGANAVNGVINIVTKTAAHTQGTLVSAGGGTGERGFGTIRYGGQITPEIHYRAYVKYFSREDMELESGRSAGNWDAMRTGVRLDWTPGVEHPGDEAHDTITLQGEMYAGRVDQDFVVSRLTPAPSATTIRDQQKMDGGHVLGRWTHQFSDEANVQFQTYYDRTHRSLQLFAEQRDTFDADFQNRFKVGERNDVIWGLGYRITGDETARRPTVQLVPDSRTSSVFSLFLQDEIDLVHEFLRLTLGSKLEHNDFTGWEVQPGARLLWTPTTNQSAWASVTRAVRTPSRAEDDVRVASVLNGGLPAELRGNRSIESEKLIAYEIGYRIQPIRSVSFDTALYYNDYEDLRTLEIGTPTATAVVEEVANRMEGRTYGIEAGANWDVTHYWKLRGSYTWMETDLRLNHSTDPANAFAERSSPRQQFMIRSSLDLPHNVEFDLAFRYVESLETRDFDSATPRTRHVPSYPSLDARIAWHPCRNLEIAIVGQNLLQNEHREFNPTTIRGPSAEVERSVYGKVTWQF
jgi:iron complex outermembrane recepter protein